ncbi:hypothetical protein RI129_001656 [Pyrocoelia pectoralis]|uniref:Thymocyte nuclear protein 1 n=1 Tax=Pyrocoelia pectoralis TaxID=417401 RepID=A0AAN7ZTR4_9COLE
MHFWLLKTEPSEYSWQKMEEEKITEWDGVANHQAQNNMKAMELGDFAFFYHTGKEKAILGVVEVFKKHYHVGNSKFGLVDVKFSKPLSSRVTLKDIKKNPLLKDMATLKQPRLTVAPVSEDEWNEIIRMSKT